MTNSKEMVRHSINLLEYPIWFQDERLAETSADGVVWRDLEGYIYRCGYKIPVKTDVIFLLYLLLQSQKANYAPIITLSRYQVIHGCGLKRNSKWYSRLEDSLERWKMVGIKFTGAFYDGKEYHTINFGVIDSWEIDKENKHLKIYFSPKFLEMMLGKSFFKYINFTEFKQLHSPLATRLYEILCKSFHGHDLWEIEAGKMAAKIPMKELYSAHIIPKIRAAIVRINKNTATKFEFMTRPSEIEPKKTILCFRKLAEAAPLSKGKPKRGIDIPQTPEMKALIELLPENRRKQQTILEMIIGFHSINGAAYVERNIRYTNKYAPENYRAYLLKALKGDYGLAALEDEETKRYVTAQEIQKVNEVTTRHAENLHRRKIEQEGQKQARAYIDALTPEAKSDLEREAIAGMDEKIQDIIRTNGMGAKTLMGLAMERVAARRLTEAAATTKTQPTPPMVEAKE
ncbi:MAG: replication initiation protein [Candidatus Ozemobacteraceae bacterium]